MADPKQLEKYKENRRAYISLVKESLQQDINAADEVLLHLLRHYADVLEEQDKASVKLIKFVSKLAHSITRNYKNYFLNKTADR